MLIRLSSPAGPVMEVADLKDRLHVSTTHDDETLGEILAAETVAYEAFTGRVMAPADFEFQSAGFSCPLVLPVAPVRAISSIAYLDENDVEQDLASADYALGRTSSGRWQVTWTDGFTAPRLSRLALPVRVRFSAGYDLPGESGGDPDLAPFAGDRINIAIMCGRVFDTGARVSGREMRDMFTFRRIFA